MAQGILLSQETYDRIMAVVEAFESGGLTILEGDGIKIDETGPLGTKISIDLSTVDLDTCDGTVTVYTQNA